MDAKIKIEVDASRLASNGMTGSIVRELLDRSIDLSRPEIKDLQIEVEVKCSLLPWPNMMAALFEDIYKLAKMFPNVTFVGKRPGE